MSFQTTPIENFQDLSNPNSNKQQRGLFPVDDSTSVIMQPATVTDLPTRSKRGRPRTKVQPYDILSAPSGSTSGRSPGTPPPGSPGAPPGSVPTEAARERERAAKAASKEREIKELTGKIVKDLNEQLMEGLITLGIPEAFLYKNPTARPLAVDSKYTPIGQAICINPMQANWIAHGIAEAKEFPAIQRLTLGTKDGPSYFWLALGGLGVLSYLQGLFTAITQMRKLMAEWKAIQEMQSPEDLREGGMQFQEAPASPFQEGNPL